MPCKNSPSCLQNASCRVPCPAGSACPNGPAYPIVCPAGYYCTECSEAFQLCPPGHFCPCENMSRPIPCEAEAFCGWGTIEPNTCREEESIFHHHRDRDHSGLHTSANNCTQDAIADNVSTALGVQLALLFAQELAALERRLQHRCPCTPIANASALRHETNLNKLYGSSNSESEQQSFKNEQLSARRELKQANKISIPAHSSHLNYIADKTDSEGNTLPAPSQVSHALLAMHAAACVSWLLVAAALLTTCFAPRKL